MAMPAGGGVGFVGVAGGLMRRVYVPEHLGGEEGNERVARRESRVASTSCEAFS